MAVVHRFVDEAQLRAVLGSDFPGVRSVCSYGEAMGWLRHFPQLAEADRRRILGETPARLWRFT